MSRSTCIRLYSATDGRQTCDKKHVDGNKWIQLVSWLHVSWCKHGFSCQWRLHGPHLWNFTDPLGTPIYRILAKHTRALDQQLLNCTSTAFCISKRKKNHGHGILIKTSSASGTLFIDFYLSSAFLDLYFQLPDSPAWLSVPVPRKKF